MQRDKNLEFQIEDRQSLSRRGESIYYLGALLFISGVVLLIIGAISIMIFQIHYESDNYMIRNVVTFVISGLTLVTLGLNLMIRQVKNGFIAITLGSICSFLSIFFFVLNYPANWIYPTINYILISYTIGLLLLVGNAFGTVTLWLIRTNSLSPEKARAKKIKYEYSDEEIEKDIENAVKKSLEKAADELEFNLEDIKPLKVGNAACASETVVKIKDDMKEAHTLEQTVNPGERETWGATGIDKTSDLLANALSEKPALKKSRSSWFSFLHKN